MIVKMNNKEENFYNYMGRMFGSRIVQKQINDRIYDVDEDKLFCFVSVVKNIIKNVYTMKDNYLVEILKQIRKEKKIQESIVPNIYKDLYIKAGFTINQEATLKNFVIIYDK